MTRGISPKQIVAGCVGGAVLLTCGVYIARSFQWREALVLLSNADLGWFFVGSGSATIAYWVVRAFRWQFLLRGMQVEVGFLDLYLCSSVALSLSIFTPLQSGEVLKIELLKKYGHVGRLPGYSSFMLERVADLYAVIAMGVVALAFRSGFLSRVTLVFLVALSLALPVVGYLLLHRLRLDGRAGEFVRQLHGGVKSLATLFVLLFSTLLGWLIVALAWQACLLSLNIVLSFNDVLGLLSILTLVTIASFIPGGIGIGEAGITEVLIRFGISEPLAQAGALILRAFSLLVILLGAFHLVLLRARLKRNGRLTRAADTPQTMNPGSSD